MAARSSTPSSCCSTPTSRSTAPRAAGRNRHEFFSTDARRNIIAAKRLVRRDPDRARARRIRSLLPTAVRCPHAGGRRRRNARPLAASGARTADARPLPDDCRRSRCRLDDRCPHPRKGAGRSRRLGQRGFRRSPKISVNVSSRRLADPGLGKKLRAQKIEPGILSFELLESISLDDCDDAVLANLKQFRKLGIDIEIDDFGTGHASIVSLLQAEPEDAQDRSGTDPHAAAIGRAAKTRPLDHRYRPVAEHPS